MPVLGPGEPGVVNPAHPQPVLGHAWVGAVRRVVVGGVRQAEVDHGRFERRQVVVNLHGVVGQVHDGEKPREQMWPRPQEFDAAHGGGGARPPGVGQAMPVIRTRRSVETDTHRDLVPLEEVQPRTGQKSPTGLELEENPGFRRRTVPDGLQQSGHVPDADEKRFPAVQDDVDGPKAVCGGVLTYPPGRSPGHSEVHSGGQAPRHLVPGVEDEAVVAVDVAAVGDLEDERPERNGAFGFCHRVDVLTAAMAR